MEEEKVEEEEELQRTQLHRVSATSRVQQRKLGVGRGEGFRARGHPGCPVGHLGPQQQRLLAKEPPHPGLQRSKWMQEPDSKLQWPTRAGFEPLALPVSPVRATGCRLGRAWVRLRAAVAVRARPETLMRPRRVPRLTH